MSSSLKCIFCNEKHNSKFRLFTHEAIHMSESSWHCSVCNIKFYSQSEYYNHKNRNRYCRNSSNLVKSHKCPKCDKSFPLLSLRHTHMTSCITSEDIPKLESENKICKLKFKKKINICKICGMMYENRGPFMNHMISHIMIKNYFCKLCNNTYEDYESFENHKIICKHEHQSKSKIVEIIVLRCPKCLSKFELERDLMQHTKTCMPPMEIEKRYLSLAEKQIE